MTKKKSASYRQEKRMRASALATTVISSRHQDIELLFETATQIAAAAEADGENIRALARFVEMRERRLSSLEGSDEA